MCTIAILHAVIADAPLVIAANRDELLARPSRPPEVLDAARGVVGGVDVQSGGTWLAVRADGRFAAVTNQRALAPPLVGLRSRGLIVRALIASEDPAAYVAALDPTASASMNLVWGRAGEVRVAYVRREEATIEVAALAPGVHVLCNDRLGAPGFPRGVRLAAAITAAARDATWATLRPRLEVALADHTRTALADVPSSHLPPAIAHALTAPCIHAGAYGTRSASLVALAPGAVVAYRHADGPPCTTPFVDVGRAA